MTIDRLQKKMLSSLNQMRKYLFKCSADYKLNYIIDDLYILELMSDKNALDFLRYYMRHKGLPTKDGNCISVA